MAKIPGLNISAPVVPIQDTDTYPSHYSKYGNGGWQEVATIAERDAISAPRRVSGMAVYVTSNGKLYTLNEDLETWTDQDYQSSSQVSNAISVHNESSTAHADIRQDIANVSDSIATSIATHNTSVDAHSNIISPIAQTLDSHVTNKSNPHEVTKAQVGLGNVDNTSDLDKPISTATQAALNAQQEEIDALSGRGRFLSLWNCVTGLPETDPETESPYVYHTGDYYIVVTVSSATPAVNYKPSGSSYVFDPAPVPSSVVETGEVSVNDTYVYDGENWILQSNAQKEVSFAALAGSPYDNVELANALDAKQDNLTSANAGTNISITTDKETGEVVISNTQDISGKVDKTDEASQVYGTDENGDQTTYDLDSFGKVDDVKIGDTSLVSNKIATIPEADSSTLGVTKLYTTTGQNTDGSMTQKSITDALDAKQNTLTAGTNISIVNDVISSTAQESFFRGNFNEWSDVPTDASLYHEDIHGNRIPHDTDFIVIEDASQFIPVGDLMHKLVVENLSSTEAYTLRITDENGVSQKYYYKPYARRFVAIDDYYSLRYDPGNPGSWFIKTNDGSPIVIKGTTYSSGQAQLCLTYDPAAPFYVGMPPSAGQYIGAWRFAYYGVWATDGKTGWTPQYKIENTLPIADSSTLGITKLYTDLGSNTDGAVDQATVTTELGKKQDTLTEGTGISIDENNVISATFSESYFRGKFSTWNTVPTDYRNYYPDYTGSTKPTRTDYMVVEDPSSYVKPGAPIEIYQLPLVSGTAYIKIVMNSQEYTFNHNDVSQNPKTFGVEGQRLYLTYNTPNWYITPLDIPVIVDGVEKPINEVAYSWDYNSGRTEYLQKTINFIGQGGYEGTWRFSYQSDNWDVTGKNGWEPEYQIEDILPIATDTDAGIMKLYTTTGSNTDGTMDQNSITTELGDLQDQIDDLKGLGRFLSVWNSSTGLPETNPEMSPYEYKSGDYYLVGTVSSSTNYRPDGTSYTKDVPSTVVETEEVHVNDVYIFDGSVWKLQANSQREYTFSGIAGSPYDNANLSNALNAKQNLLTNASNAGEGIIIDDVTQEISTNNIVWRKW